MLPAWVSGDLVFLLHHGSAGVVPLQIEERRSSAAKRAWIATPTSPAYFLPARMLAGGHAAFPINPGCESAMARSKHIAMGGRAPERSSSIRARTRKPPAIHLEIQAHSIFPSITCGGKMNCVQCHNPQGWTS